MSSSYTRFPEILSDLAKKAWSAKLFDENVKETSPYFILPQCLLAAKLGKNERAKRDISGIEQQIDDIVFGLDHLQKRIGRELTGGRAKKRTIKSSCLLTIQTTMILAERLDLLLTS